MTRPQDWPDRLTTYVEAAMAKPFAWGSHDCATYSCGWHKLMTGRDVYAQFRGRYDSEIGSQRIMLSLGIRDMDGMGRYLFGEPRDGNKFIQRGDIVLALDALGVPCLGVCVGAHAALVSEAGRTVVPFSHIMLGWRV